MLNDPYIVIYTIGGILIVLVAFVVLSLFTEGVKSLNEKLKSEEQKKKDEVRDKFRKAG